MRRLLPALLTLNLLAAPAPPHAAKRPRLVAVISIDQFSADLLARYGEGLPGGLGELERRGTWFQAAYHAHGYTETGPGHSVLLSGRYPAHTGITENSWLDRAAGHSVYCVEDDTARLVGQPERLSSSQGRFIGTTLGDWLQAQVPGSRAFGLSGKDRAAILMSGRRPTAVYWFEGAAGFSTSTAYAKALPPWMQAFDTELQQRFAARSWVWTASAPSALAAPSATYTINGTALRLGLPRLVGSVGMAQDKDFFDRFKASPFFDAVTVEAAERLIREEHLGHGRATDLLALSLSATDYVGHHFGTQGAEMQDQILRLDRELGELFKVLRKASPDVWIVLSADHGGMDFPERLAEQGLPAHRLDPGPWGEALEQKLRERFKLPADSHPILKGSSVRQIYLDEAAMKASGLERGAFLEEAAKLALAMPGVEAAYTAPQMDAMAVPDKAPTELSLAERTRLSYVPGRSGDLLLVLKPLTIVDGGLPYIEDHGSPWDYDRRVPLIFLGPWKAERRPEPVRTVDLAATLADQLGLKPGEAIDGHALRLVPAK